MGFATFSPVGRAFHVSPRKGPFGPGAGRASAGGGRAAERTARRAGGAVSGAGQGIPGRHAILLGSSRKGQDLRGTPEGRRRGLPKTGEAGAEIPRAGR